MDPTGLVEQLIQVMSNRLLDPLEILLEDPVVDVRARCERAARIWAARLTGPNATYAVASIIGALYPSDDVFDPPAGWWRTPLGRVVLRQMGFPGKAAVSYAVAGEMLGMTRQGVHDLVTRDKLTRHPDGGVTVTSIQERVQLKGPRT
ncbi:hypothetical protein [Actinocrispum wychmicini]|uniref:Uncharacterized protein n=1 Tax=Actinocrispum wychmicini TaxID=1213861 RepID=A0A4R2JMB0_9PSEU|nr:hypothetical protein [Actinocrispum wychmicini]TCO58256.1 hypothetical protein EV192_105321 [Actinocrispum wychmicini]